VLIKRNALLRSFQAKAIKLKDLAHHSGTHHLRCTSNPKKLVEILSPSYQRGPHQKKMKKRCQAKAQRLKSKLFTSMKSDNQMLLL
jgi:hypothetical protein